MKRPSIADMLDVVAPYTRADIALSEERLKVDNFFNPKIQQALNEGDVETAKWLVEYIPYIVSKVFALDAIRQHELGESE